MKYRGIILADMHIESSRISRIYYEYREKVIARIKDGDIDYIVICGDWTDGKIYLQDEASAYSYRMIKDIIDTAKEVNHPIKIRIVYGTESHENDQYKIISMMCERDNLQCDIKVIKTVSEEFLFEDMKVLYVPEEHIEDKREYYKEYFSKEKEYDYVFGHGIIREGMTVAAAKLDENKDKRKKVPVFSAAEFRKICKGKTYFGHYHCNDDMDDVYYVGSFSRWCFNEDIDKGYYIL